MACDKRLPQRIDVLAQENKQVRKAGKILKSPSNALCIGLSVPPKFVRASYRNAA